MIEKWEYRIEEMGYYETKQAVDFLNQAGQEGWEVVCMWKNNFAIAVLLKRRIQPSIEESQP